MSNHSLTEWQTPIEVACRLVMGRLIGIGIEHLQNRAFDRESESHRKN